MLESLRVVLMAIVLQVFDSKQETMSLSNLMAD